MADSMAIVVTGANRGIGHALVQQFASKPPATPLTIYACARNPSSIASVKTAEGVTVRPSQLDVSDASSIKTVAEGVHEANKQGVDIVINNAGVYYAGNHTKDNAKYAVAVNLNGILEMTRAFGPYMRRPGLSELGGKSRIINLSSEACSMKPGPFGSYSLQLKQACANASTIDDFISLRNAYVRAVEQDRDNEQDDGWPKHNSYKVTKTLINVLTCVTARDEQLGKGILIECCCPGWVGTDMGSVFGSAPKTPEQGAMVPAALATTDLKGVTGEYWALPSVSQTSLDNLSVRPWLD